VAAATSNEEIIDDAHTSNHQPAARAEARWHGGGLCELQQQDRAKDLDHAEWLALLIDREAASRSTNRFRSRLKSAKLRHSQASVEDVDYRAARKLDRALFQQLATCRWIAEHRCLLVTGPCGVGKSWLSCALAQKACRDGYSVHDARVPRSQLS
jgi:DNA replication protein DnaC